MKGKRIFLWGLILALLLAAGCNNDTPPVDPDDPTPAGQQDIATTGSGTQPANTEPSNEAEQSDPSEAEEPEGQDETHVTLESTTGEGGATQPTAPTPTEPPATAQPTQPQVTEPRESEPAPTEPQTTQATEPLTVAPETTPVHPGPVDPQDQTVSETEMTCTLIIRCDTALASDALSDDKREILPEDGFILFVENAVFYKGETVFAVLQREIRENRIHMEHVTTPVFGSAYIEGIGNLYELDCGPLSGWMYRVSGWFPNYGCSRYVLNEGDTVEWLYTCDLGSDIGGQGASIGGGDE